MKRKFISLLVLLCILCPYTVNSEELQPPTITVYRETDEEVALLISVPEGTTVYYKDMRMWSSYEATTSDRLLTVTESTTVVAYAMSGTLKSDVVYYVCDITELYDGPEDTLEEPEVTVTDIKGGKRVTVKVPDGINLCKTEKSVNYGLGHDVASCNNSMEEFQHTMNDPWSIETIDNGIWINIGDSHSQNAEFYYDDREYTFDIYENTCVETLISYDYSKQSGQWHLIIVDPGTPGFHELENHELENAGVTSEYNSSSSKTVYMYVEVKKLSKPIISVLDKTVTITAENGASVFYSINGGKFKEYSEPFTAADTACIKAYAIADGMAQSEMTMYGIETSVSSQFAQNPDTGLVPDFEITVTNSSDKTVTNAQLIVASFDGETLKSIVVKDALTLKNGITKITDISPAVPSGATDAKVSVFLWRADGSICPLAAEQTYQVK